MSLSLSTPTTLPTQCVPFTFVGANGVSPYTFKISNDTLGLDERFPNLTAPTFQWTPDFSVGTQFTVTLSDSAGAAASAGPLTVQNGTGNATCLPGQRASKSNSAATSRREGVKAKIMAVGALGFVALSLLAV